MARPTLNDLSRRTFVVGNNARIGWVCRGDENLQPGRITFAIDPVIVEFENHIVDSWVSLRSKKKPPLDRLYPHECANPSCAQKLKFNELLDALKNMKLFQEFITKTFHYLDKKYIHKFDFETLKYWACVFGAHEYCWHLRKLWKSPHVKFYCCSCYENKIDGENKTEYVWL